MSHKISRAIEELGGVVSARIRVSSGGDIEEVHVVARGNRRAKEIVRDVETLLRAKFDLEIDHRKISVARLSETSQPDAQPEVPGRLGFKGVSLHVTRDGSEAAVELAWGERDWVGTAASTGPEPGWPNLVARATLDAVTRVLPAGSHLELSDLASITLDDSDVILLMINYRDGRYSQLLLGCARVDEDLQRSVVYATLHAVNRFLGRFTTYPQRELILEPPGEGHLVR